MLALVCSLVGAAYMTLKLAYTYGGVFGSRAGEISLPKRKRRIWFRSRRRGFRGALATVLSRLLPPKEERL